MSMRPRSDDVVTYVSLDVAAQAERDRRLRTGTVLAQNMAQLNHGAPTLFEDDGPAPVATACSRHRMQSKWGLTPAQLRFLVAEYGPNWDDGAPSLTRARIMLAQQTVDAPVAHPAIADLMVQLRGVCEY